MEDKEKKKKEVTVTMKFHGNDHTPAEIREAAGQMLSQCKPAVVGKEVIFLDTFVIL